MLKAIIAALTALPQLIGLIRDVFSWVRTLSDEKPSDVIRETRSAFRSAKEAKDKTGRIDAAKKIARIISGK